MFEYVARVGEIEILILILVLILVLILILVLVLVRYMMECCGFVCGRLV
jgi:hypothetical protein